MTEFEKVYADISYSRPELSNVRMIEEMQGLCCGRNLAYAPVDQPKSFVSDMKPNTGRLMDFNKGTHRALILD